MHAPTSAPTSFQAAKILDQVHLPQHFPVLADVLEFCRRMGPAEAALFVIVGIIMLLAGIHIFKGVVIANAAIVGAAIGIYVIREALEIIGEARQAREQTR